MLTGSQLKRAKILSKEGKLKAKSLKDLIKEEGIDESKYDYSLIYDFLIVKYNIIRFPWLTKDEYFDRSTIESLAK